MGFFGAPTNGYTDNYDGKIDLFTMCYGLVIIPTVQAAFLL